MYSGELGRTAVNCNPDCNPGRWLSAVPSMGASCHAGDQARRCQLRVLPSGLRVVGSAETTRRAGAWNDVDT
jgi:hypothetical protein